MEFSPISPRAFSRVLVADASSEAGSVKSTAARCQKVFPSFPGCGICTRLDDVTACGVEQVGDVHEVVHAPFGPSLKSLELPEISYKELALLRRREQLLQRLFRLHDLSGNGMLEEVELTKLNEKIAMLHHGKLVPRRMTPGLLSNQVLGLVSMQTSFATSLTPRGTQCPTRGFGASCSGRCTP
eukprot:TRINITY_DN2047_c0_g1_i3.p1 TRINITY_DN2047_c0_g1~~TRINITY_DN2047_c0_g1_i3.p1  ORF type:complete len:184 (-),score=17.49 TRINITY_DN2047_c0_g1_i3:554-1105(-)